MRVARASRRALRKTIATKHQNQQKVEPPPIRVRSRAAGVNAAVCERKSVEQHTGFGFITAEGAWARQHGRHDREYDQDPDQNWNVAENLYVESHQLGHEPVVGQAQNPRKTPNTVAVATGQNGNKQCVENADDGGTTLEDWLSYSIRRWLMS